jgi:hypothetical protein
MNVLIHRHTGAVFVFHVVNDSTKDVSLDVNADKSKYSCRGESVSSTSVISKRKGN